jgi:hypothetical protein
VERYSLEIGLNIVLYVVMEQRVILFTTQDLEDKTTEYTPFASQNNSLKWSNVFVYLSVRCKFIARKTFLKVHLRAVFAQALRALQAKFFDGRL